MVSWERWEIDKVIKVGKQLAHFQPMCKPYPSQQYLLRETNVLIKIVPIGPSHM